MYKLLQISCVFIVLGFATMSISAQSDWVGTYEFSEDGGKTAGGTAILVQHDLEIVEGDGGLIAFLKSNGYQTSKDLICTAKVAGGKLNIHFESYGEDNVFESYEPGDLLLTLDRKSKTMLLTHWGKFTPIIPKNEKSGKPILKKCPCGSLKANENFTRDYNQYSVGLNSYSLCNRVCSLTSGPLDAYPKRRWIVFG